MDMFKGQELLLWKGDNYKQLDEQVFILKSSVNRRKKTFIQNDINDWCVKEVSSKLQNVTDLADAKISLKLSDLKPLYAKSVNDLHNHICKEKEITVKGPDRAKIL